MQSWLVLMLELPLAAVLIWIYQGQLPAGSGALTRWGGPIASILVATAAAEIGFALAHGGGQLWPHILAALCAFAVYCAAFGLGWWYVMRLRAGNISA